MSGVGTRHAENKMSGVQQFGSYVFLKKFAVGGMAELYKARKSGAKGFQKLFAAKKILPHLAMNEEFIGMLIDEAKVAALLDHPNIVRIYDLGKVEDSYCIVMEYVRGRDLRKVLNRAAKLNSPIPIPEACLIAASVLAGLSSAHTKKFKGKELDIVHRDVSPQNILVSFDGEVKIADFGIAKAANQNSETKEGVLKGKVSYMSPEQARGRHLDRRSDIFSVGVILYEMLTGKKLFHGDSDIVTLKKVWMAKVDPLPSTVNPAVPKELDGIILKALSRDPSGRYQAAAEMERELYWLMRAEGFAADSYSLGGYVSSLFKEEFEAELQEDEELLEGEVPVESFKAPEARDEHLPVSDMPDMLTSVTKLAPAKAPGWPRWLYWVAGAAAAAVIPAIAFMFHKPETVKPAIQMPPTAAPPAPSRPATSAKPETKKPESGAKRKAQAVMQEAKGRPSQMAIIATAPPGAAVYVDGSYLGETPLSVPNPKERHRYSVKALKDGYEDWTGTLVTDAEGKGSLTAVLKKKAAAQKTGDMWSDPFPKSPLNTN